MPLVYRKHKRFQTSWTRFDSWVVCVGRGVSRRFDLSRTGYGRYDLNRRLVCALFPDLAKSLKWLLAEWTNGTLRGS